MSNNLFCVDCYSTNLIAMTKRCLGNCDGDGPVTSKEGLTKIRKEGNPPAREGDKDDQGREFVAGRWRTVERIHGMACYSLVEQLRLDGPLTRSEICRKTGLAEIRAQRAIETCIKDGDIKSAGANKYYVPGE